MEEYFQSTASIKSYQQSKIPELDCSKNMIQYKIRFEVPEVCIIVKLIFGSYFYSQLIYIVLLLIGTVAFILFKLNPDVILLSFFSFFVCILYVCVLIKSFLNFKKIFVICIPHKSICNHHLHKQLLDLNNDRFFFLLQVSIQFYHLVEDCELPVVEIVVLGLGTEVELRTFDLKANAFLKEFCLKCPEYLGKNLCFKISNFTI